MGALHPARCGARGVSEGTLILLGAGADFWPAYQSSMEAADAKPDPIDRWSARVVGTLATEFRAEAHYPFGGPPYTPFIDWALKSNRTFHSSVGMMVHDQVGLLISYRGALHFDDELEIPVADAASPCLTCPDQPCTDACPVDALHPDAPYDLDQCHSYLDTAPGQTCMTQGCAARLICPVSAGAGRHSAQSAHHMKAFHSK